jgi:hypothetical protein
VTVCATREREREERERERVCVCVAARTSTAHSGGWRFPAVRRRAERTRVTRPSACRLAAAACAAACSSRRRGARRCTQRAAGVCPVCCRAEPAAPARGRVGVRAAREHARAGMAAGAAAAPTSTSTMAALRTMPSSLTVTGPETRTTESVATCSSSPSVLASKKDSGCAASERSAAARSAWRGGETRRQPVRRRPREPPRLHSGGARQPPSPTSHQAGRARAKLPLSLCGLRLCVQLEPERRGEQAAGLVLGNWSGLVFRAA